MPKPPEPSIAELCKPLSAKVMPRAQLYTVGGQALEPERARAIAQAPGVNKVSRKLKQKAGK